MAKLLNPINGEVVNVMNEVQRLFAERNSNGQIWQDRTDWVAKRKAEMGGDASRPLPVRFDWLGVGEEKNNGYVFELADNPDFENSFTVTTDKTYYEKYNLFIGTKYYWRVNGSEPQTFETSAMAPRWMYVEGVSNVRDLGGRMTKSGRRVKQGMLYRGGNLTQGREKHDPVPYETKKRFREDLKLRSEINLCFEDIGVFDSCILNDKTPENTDINYFALPSHGYRGFIFNDKSEDYPTVDPIHVLRVLADEKNYPIYFHCVLGADRTGTLAYVILTLLGVDEHDIRLDYEATGLSMYGFRGGFGDNSMITKLQRLLDCTTPPGTPRDKQIESFMRGAGLSQEEIDNMKNFLLE